MKPPNPKSVVFTLSALWILWGFGFQTLWVRYTTELEGVVVYSHHTSRTPRYGTEYVIRDASGHDTHYVAGATDASLDRSIPVGSRIEKKWGQLGYALDGEWQSFPAFSMNQPWGSQFSCSIGQRSFSAAQTDNSSGAAQSGFILGALATSLRSPAPVAPAAQLQRISRLAGVPLFFRSVRPARPVAQTRAQ